MLHQLLWLVILSFLSFGCGSVFKLPANRFESPEVQGIRWKGDVMAASSGTANLTVTDDFSTTQPDTSNPRFERRYFTPGGSINVGALEKADVSLHAFENSAGKLTFKYQVAGQNKANSKPGNTSLTPSVSVGYAETNPTATLDNGNIVRYKKVKEVFDVALIAGHRFSDTTLLYLTGFYTVFPFFGEWEDGVVTEPVMYSGEAQRIGGAAGLEITFAKRGVMRIEVAFARFTSENAFLDAVFPGLQLGVSF